MHATDVWVYGWIDMVQTVQFAREPLIWRTRRSRIRALMYLVTDDRALTFKCVTVGSTYLLTYLLTTDWD